MTDDTSRILLDVLRSSPKIPSSSSSSPASMDTTAEKLKHILLFGGGGGGGGGGSTSSREISPKTDVRKEFFENSDASPTKSRSSLGYITDETDTSPRMTSGTIKESSRSYSSGKLVEREKTKVSGILLKGQTVCVDLDSLGDRLASQDLPVKSVFSWVQSDFRPDYTKKIVMNDTYVCYATREGKIRVLRRSDGANTLFREHKGSVLDMTMCTKTGKIASISENNCLLVWEPMDSITDKALIDIKVLSQIQEPYRPGLLKPYLKRVFWHPNYEDLIAIMTSLNEIIFVRIHGQESSEETILDFASSSIYCVQASITSVTAFSFNQNGSIFAVGSEDGSVKLWSYTTRSLLQDFRPHKEASISSLCFIETRSKGPSPLPLLLIGADNNRTLSLWNIATGTCVQVVSFISGAESFGLVSNPIEYVDAASCLIYCCTSKKSIYMLRFQGPYSTGTRKSSLHKGTDLQESLSEAFDFSHCGFVCMTGYLLTMPVLNFTVEKKSFGSQTEPIESLGIVCIQTKAIQEYESPLLSLPALSPSDRLIVEGTEHLLEAEGWKKTISEIPAKLETEKKRIKPYEDDLSVSSRDREVTKVRLKADSRKGPIEILKKPRSDLPLSDTTFITGAVKDSDSKQEQPRILSRVKPPEVQNTYERPQVSIVPEADKFDALIKMSEAQYQAISQLLELMERFNSTIERASKEAILPNSERIQDSVTGAIQKAMKLNTTQLLFDDAFLGKLTDSISTNLIKNMMDMLRDQFQKVLVPSFERSFQEMFRQVDRVFSVRLQEFQTQVSSSASKPAIGQEIDRLSDQMASLLINLKHDIHLQQSQLTETISKTLTENVTNAIWQKLGRDANGTFSESSFFSEGLNEANLGLIIDKLVNQEKYEDAFIKALSFGNLKLVIDLCSRTDPRKVLSNNGGDAENRNSISFSQSVILSLIQQLSHDMSENTDLKLQWIQESLLALDSHDSIIANHLPTVLHQVIQSLGDSSQSTSSKLNSSQIRQSKLVLRLAKSLLN